MKKLLFFALFASAATLANAQAITSKNGTPILPEAGEWSVGFDAVPFINTFGGIFRAPVSNGSSGFSQIPMTLVGSHVTDANTQMRGMLRIGFGSTDNNFNPGTNTTDSILNPSEVKTTGMNITIGAGIQKNRGKGRLQGIYGAQVMVKFAGAVTTDKTYANGLGKDSLATGNTQITEEKTGSTFGIGLNGFIGGEYFFGAKMSIGAEYGWGLMLSSTGAGSTTTNSWNTAVTPNVVQTKSVDGGKSSSFSLDVMDAASLNLKIYF